SRRTGAEKGKGCAEILLAKESSGHSVDSGNVWLRSQLRGRQAVLGFVEVNIYRSRGSVIFDLWLVRLAVCPVVNVGRNRNRSVCRCVSIDVGHIKRSSVKMCSDELPVAESQECQLMLWGRCRSFRIGLFGLGNSDMVGWAVHQTNSLLISLFQ